jgi:hypothetical protein
MGDEGISQQLIAFAKRFDIRGAIFFSHCVAKKHFYDNAVSDKCFRSARRHK